MPSDFSKELLGIHASPLVLSVSSRKEQMSPGLEYNEVSGCIAMPPIESDMYWAFDKCFLKGKKKNRGKKGSGEGGMDEGRKEDREGRGTYWGILFFFPIYAALAYVQAKSLQLYPTLCDPVGCRQPGSSVHGILQARTLEWVCHALLQGIFLTQGLNSCLQHLQHWEVGSLPLAPPGKPIHTSLDFHLNNES